MKKALQMIIVTSLIFALTSCTPYQGNITVGGSKASDEEEQQAEKVEKQIGKQEFENDSEKDLSLFDDNEISGRELQVFIDSYKGDPSIAILISTAEFVGISTMTLNGEGYIGTVGYDKLPIVYISDMNGMYWGSYINYNAQYAGELKVNSDGTEFTDTAGFVKDSSGKVEMYTFFEDAGIDPSYTEYIDKESKFYTSVIKNEEGDITGIIFVE